MACSRVLILLTFAFFGSFLVGCGTKYQTVTGEIVFADGTPAKGLSGGTIAFQKVGTDATTEGTNPTSPIDSEGKFRLGTNQPGDGAPEGEYMYVINRPVSSGDEQLPKVIADKHTRFDESIKETVKKGANHLKIVVEPYK